MTRTMLPHRGTTSRTARHRARALALLPLAVLLATAVAACGDDSSSSAATTTSKATTTVPAATSGAASEGTSTVAVATTDLGRVLVDAKGMTLYAFTPDTATTSACTGGCASAWPALTATGTPSGDGVTGRLTVIKRDDGTQQVVVAGHPLYTYAGDSARGDTTGQGSGGKWYVVAADGSPIKQAAASTSTSTTAAGRSDGY
jgi:predicted lipoprotein with Yx(FWY)xxD motif